MASFLSGAKSVSSFIARRGYAAEAASQGAAASSIRGGAPSVMLKKGVEESTKTSWVPDPVTGYYRPESQGKEIDAAELRALLLKNTTKHH